jgi:plasmid stability protein
MAKSITIRDVPDRTAVELAARAALSGRSLQEYIRAQLIEFANRPDPEVLVARIRERKSRTGSKLSKQQILEYRAADRR